MNFANWLNVLVLPYNSADLYAMMFVLSMLAKYSNIALHTETSAIIKTNKTKTKIKKFVESTMNSSKLPRVSVRFVSNEQSSLSSSTYGAGQN